MENGQRTWNGWMSRLVIVVGWKNCLDRGLYLFGVIEIVSMISIDSISKR